MSDTGDDYRAMHANKKALKAKYGAPCPMCQQHLPKADPSILLPQGRCRIHGYRDQRPLLTDEQRSNA
jgi:hypothetical protein